MSIQTKIKQYLKKELAVVTDPRERENRQEVIDYLEESKGECSGLSVMWAYGRMTAPSEAATSFNQTNKLLLDWDGERNFSGKEKEDVERFVEDVIFHQRGQMMFLKDSVDLLQLSPDAEGREFQRSYKTDRAFLSKDLLQDRLEKIIQPNAMILLSASVDEDGHRVAVSKSPDGKIYYYDSNNKEEMSFNSVSDLTDRVWEDTKRGKLKKTDVHGSINVTDFKIDQMFRELNVDVVQFVGAQYSKPSQFLPSAVENEYFLQSRGKAIAGLMNEDVMQRHFLSLDAESQINLINGASENKEIFVRLLVNDLLNVNHRNQHVTDPAIADYLVKDQSEVIQSLIAKNLVPKEAPELLGDKPKLLYGLSRSFEEACHKEDFNKVESLVKMGIKVKQNNILTLIEKDKPEIISFLLEENKLDLYNFSPSTIDKFNCEDSPIVYAARIGAMKNLELMVSQLDKDKEKENKIVLGQALYWSCSNGHEDAVKFLLEQGADPDVTCQAVGKTALEIATSHNSLAIVQELILHQVDTKKGSPIAYAKGPEVAELLLANGASPETTENGRTLLMKACSDKDVEMVKVLLEHGANPNSSSGSGYFRQTVMQYSSHNSNEYNKTKTAEIQELLLEHGAYAESAKGETSTNIAVTFAEGLSSLGKLLMGKSGRC